MIQFSVAVLWRFNFFSFGLTAELSEIPLKKFVQQVFPNFWVELQT